jgi:alpha/beta superfamily hydrolase
LTEGQVSFPTADGLELEGLLHQGKGANEGRWVMLCHPHPLYGGDMHNNVVEALQRSLAREGFSTLRFNFRGVGGSRGEYGERAGEVKDVRGAVDFIAREAGADHDCYLLGYSFGAYVGVQGVTADNRVKAIMCISPPVALYDFAVLKEEERPKLIVSGQRDLICPVLPVEELFAALPEPKTMHICPGADHFWWGMEAHITDYVLDFFQGL